MSRFSDWGTFFYAPAADNFAGVLYSVYLDPSNMPQYPFQVQTVTDRVNYRSKSGKSWMYENYNLDSYTFRWSMMDELTRGSLKTMYDSKPLVNFCSGTNNFGTFRIAESSWKD